MRNITAPGDPITRTEWKTPVPYVLGAAGSIIGLIVFAFLLLVCSCWKDSFGHSGENNMRSGHSNESTIEYNEIDETVVVIMAGDEKPTFIAKSTFDSTDPEN